MICMIRIYVVEYLVVSARDAVHDLVHGELLYPRLLAAVRGRGEDISPVHTNCNTVAVYSRYITCNKCLSTLHTDLNNY